MHKRYSPYKSTSSEPSNSHQQKQKKLKKQQISKLQGIHIHFQMATLSPLVTGVPVEGVYFPPVVKPPGSTKPFFLAGAGYRGGHLNGIYVKATTTGVYLEDNAIPWLAAKWKGKTAQQLWESDELYEDIVKGPFEKFFHLRNILPLTGKDFSEKVAGNMAAIIKAAGVYSDREAKAIEKFVDIYKDKFLPVGHSNLYTQSPTGSLAIAFSNDGSIPEECGVVIENKPVSEVLLNSIIGKNGVSPTAKQSLAERLSQILKENSESFQAKKK